MIERLEAQLEQNRKDQKKLKEEEGRLVKEIEDAEYEEWKFGDIVIFISYDKKHYKRYLLYDNTGKLTWFTDKGFNYAPHKKYYYKVAAKNCGYKKIGNLFE